MLQEKLTVLNLCGGDLRKQVEKALEKIAGNIEKYGADADHQIDIQIKFDKNTEFSHWEHICRTTVQCKLKDSQMGGFAPFGILKGALVDNNPQQDLPIPAPE